MIRPNQKIFPPLHFSPIKYDKDIDVKIVHLATLDEEDKADRAKIRQLAKGIDHIPEAQLALAKTYRVEGKYLKYLNLLNHAHKKHPENIPVKVEIAIEKFLPIEDELEEKGLRKLFIDELNCLFKGKRLEHTISDADLYLLLLTLAKYFQLSDKEKQLKRLFVIAKSWGLEEIASEIAYNIKNKDMPAGMNLHLIGPIANWSSRILDELADFDIQPRPHHELFYHLLNLPIDQIGEKEVGEIVSMTDKDQIKHDILWLIDQGVARTKWSNGAANLDFYTNAVAVAAEKEMEELTPILGKFQIDIPEEIHEEMYGDIAHYILGAPYKKLASLNLSGFHELLIYQSEQRDFWYIKSVVVSSIASLIASNGKNRDEALQMFHDLWHEYEENDHIMLGWLMHDILNFDIGGFDEKIKKAFQDGLIDTFSHGTWEELQDEGFYRNHEIIKEWTNIEDFYQQVRDKIESFSSGFGLSIDKNISESIKRQESLAREYNEILDDLERISYLTDEKGDSLEE